MGNALLKLCASCGGEDTPARITAAWAAGGALAEGAWAVHGGRLAKVVYVNPNDGEVVVLYADDGAESGRLQPEDVAAAGPAQVAEGEAMLDALGAGPSSPLGRPLSPRAVWRMIS